MTDWGGHHPDCAQWGMGTELTGPVEIRNARATFPPDPLWNTATEFSFEAVYENGVTMIISNKEKMGVTFEGDEGTGLRQPRRARRRPEVDPRLEDRRRTRSTSTRATTTSATSSTASSRAGPTAAPVEVAHRSITICHLGNIAMRLGRESLRWDPRTERIIGDDEAAKMLGRPYRGPWKLEV